MALKQIRINNLRIIEELELEPAEGINLIWGENGSGKTTILEAVYLLGRGKSFRNAEQGQLLKKDAKQLTLFARTENSQGSHAVGFAKGGRLTQAKLDGNRVSRMSDLARAIPLTIINPNSHEILERGPQYRRRFLDWGVFHVEQSFRGVFERYSRCLKQRNAALRLRGRFDASWDRELIESGNQVNILREKYISKLKDKITELSSDLLNIEPLEIDWMRGWPDKGDLEQITKEAEQGDIQTGYTRYGPHRADLSIKLKGQKVEKIASRGQQKMLVATMHLAQAELARELAGTETIILIDDLTSELDQTNREILLNQLNRLGNQTLITGVDNISQTSSNFSKVFHVEHGSISQS
jgi:DNA replication and repair protein RecF